LRILGWMTSLVISLVIAGLAFVYFSPDYNMYIVRSESMKPSINMGDVIVTGPLAGLFSQQIKPGVIVSYQTGESLITHRVLSLDGETLLIKGDAVEDPDPQPVVMSQVKGLYLFKIPKLGYVSAFIHTKPGWFLAIVLPAIALLSLIIKEIIKEALSAAPAEARRR
jgi:signal peptidase I